MHKLAALDPSEQIRHRLLAAIHVIDDDEAFNSEDEMRYGSFFSMTTKKKSKKHISPSISSKKARVKNIGDDESVEQSDYINTTEKRVESE